MTTPRRRYPMKPGDPRLRAFTEDHVRSLLSELHERGRKFGLVWPSSTTDRTMDGQVLVCFNTAPLSTLLNLLTLLLDADREPPCDS
ncbi:hypothetical protein [Streptomyces sp. NRRL WC-3742]|uniref:hypothetical protein n=1 Tax=Streptomyces sp. NRRL WC-3742 TaxID=1463934 RepID=UPI0004CC086D|nr:hypothetical protein [Streptomyces sp. NRRL WC-3742]